MNELLLKIYDITTKMELALNGEKYEEFEELLILRNDVMNKVDALKEINPSFTYSPEEKQLLTDVYNLNTKLTTRSEEIQQKIQQSINMNKQVIKYKPYFKQTNGIFVDKNN